MNTLSYDTSHEWVCLRDFAFWHRLRVERIRSLLFSVINDSKVDASCLYKGIINGLKSLVEN